ncbi:MAG: hypothetical protein Q7U66_16565 [Methylobacter sp.]|nr:hypothetical protein [Methylobacter sp.]
MNEKSVGWVATAWTDICSCNICIPHVHVGYAGGRAMQEQRSGVPRR